MDFGSDDDDEETSDEQDYQEQNGVSRSPPSDDNSHSVAILRELNLNKPKESLIRTTFLGVSLAPKKIESYCL